ncbi:kinase-regulated stress-responsive transcription factor skn7 [Lobulomyces angularis]|nr:kinase-regulated stress-responsive transcription factor skn7 [Lobulomyces angularis]
MKTLKFVEKLYSILENGEFSQCIEWSEAGNSFIITDTDLFQKNVLPIYFSHSNLKSFVRQINYYNFQKRNRKYFYRQDVSEKEKDQKPKEFSNVNFIKGRPDLLKNIFRKTNSTTSNSTNKCSNKSKCLSITSLHENAIECEELTNIRKKTKNENDNIEACYNVTFMAESKDDTPLIQDDSTITSFDIIDSEIASKNDVSFENDVNVSAASVIGNDDKFCMQSPIPTTTSTFSFEATFNCCSPLNSCFDVDCVYPTPSKSSTTPFQFVSDDMHINSGALRFSNANYDRTIRNLSEEFYSCNTPTIASQKICKRTSLEYFCEKYNCIDATQKDLQEFCRNSSISNDSNQCYSKPNQDCYQGQSRFQKENQEISPLSYYSSSFPSSSYNSSDTEHNSLDNNSTTIMADYCQNSLDSSNTTEIKVTTSWIGSVSICEEQAVPPQVVSRQKLVNSPVPIESIGSFENSAESSEMNLCEFLNSVENVSFDIFNKSMMLM